MRIELSKLSKSQTYIVAVSGGVDSVVLFHLLITSHNFIPTNLIVAHFDHGMRSDSAEDKALVRNMAEQAGCSFESGQGILGKNASEATAREVRYKFLRSIQEKYRAKAIITAHHQDDLLETVVLNMLRGSGRRGYTSLRSSEFLVRPLLQTAKTDITTYAKKNKLVWREDSTNSDETYRRNYIRKRIMPKLTQPARKTLLSMLDKQEVINDEMDSILDLYVATDTLPRNFLLNFSYKERCEILASWLRKHQLFSFDRLLIERLAVSTVVTRPGRCIDIYDGASVKSLRSTITLQINA